MVLKFEEFVNENYNTRFDEEEIYKYIITHLGDYPILIVGDNDNLKGVYFDLKKIESGMVLKAAHKIYSWGVYIPESEKVEKLDKLIKKIKKDFKKGDIVFIEETKISDIETIAQELKNQSFIYINDGEFQKFKLDKFGSTQSIYDMFDIIAKKRNITLE